MQAVVQPMAPGQGLATARTDSDTSPWSRPVPLTPALASTLIRGRATGHGLGAGAGAGAGADTTRGAGGGGATGDGVGVTVTVTVTVGTGVGLALGAGAEGAGLAVGPTTVTCWVMLQTRARRHSAFCTFEEPPAVLVDVC